MSYSRWGSYGLGWYIYAGANEGNDYLYVSPGCPCDLECRMHTKGESSGCEHAEYLSKARVTMLRDILNEALAEWGDEGAGT